MHMYDVYVHVVHVWYICIWVKHVMYSYMGCACIYLIVCICVINILMCDTCAYVLYEHTLDTVAQKCQ